MSSRNQCVTKVPNQSLEDDRVFRSSEWGGDALRGSAPGSLNDELMVRSVLTASIKRSSKSREVIADEMSVLLGITVTARMITAFTAESKELHRWPGAWDRAFCSVVGDTTLLTCRAELAGFCLITAEDEAILKLGRAYLQRTAADEQMASLQTDLLRRPR